MAEILLLEPNYNNKYPPLGLMKISYYHNVVRGDYVRFAKGSLPESFNNKKWDRVYVATLFTFEWEATKRAIRYALSVAQSPNVVYIGGIAATLMKNAFIEEFPEIPEAHIVTGLLNVNGKFGYADDGMIDTITPDYSMLDDIREQYVYPTENAYFMYTTRGCGMNCGFCAVQQLEPIYQPRVPITDQINNIISNYGEKKDLLLMDNNVLKSPKFNEIIDEIKALGFHKGATFKSPASGKFIKRYVDFNQGLDAFLLTEEKAAKLSEIAIKPARIAFDHIEDKNKYCDAIRQCAQNGITELSNYVLYNSDCFKGKGHSYQADDPTDLYNRMKLTMELKDDLNRELPEDRHIAIFSFPMRYIPLTDNRRGYVGEKWNMKYLRAIQRMLIPTQGKGVSSRSFFEADFGKSQDEYMEILAMPEDIIANRGRFEEKQDESILDSHLRRTRWKENKQFRQEWEKLFHGLGKRKDSFIELISDNVFSVNKFIYVKDEEFKKLFLFYYSESQFLNLLNGLTEADDILSILEYCTKEFPLYLDRVVSNIYSHKSISSTKLAGFLKVFSRYGISLILQKCINDNFANENLLKALDIAQSNIKTGLLNVTLLITYKNYNQFKCIGRNDTRLAEKYILEGDNQSLLNILKKNSSKFKKALTNSIKNDVGSDELVKQIDILTNELFKQLSLY